MNRRIGRNGADATKGVIPDKLHSRFHSTAGKRLAINSVSIHLRLRLLYSAWIIAHKTLHKDDERYYQNKTKPYVVTVASLVAPLLNCFSPPAAFFEVYVQQCLKMYRKIKTLTCKNLRNIWDLNIKRMLAGFENKIKMINRYVSFSFYIFLLFFERLISSCI